MYDTLYKWEDGLDIEQYEFMQIWMTPLARFLFTNNCDEIEARVSQFRAVKKYAIRFWPKN